MEKKIMTLKQKQKLKIIIQQEQIIKKKEILK